MKLPWVSRLAYEDRGESITALLSQLSEERARYERLVDKLSALQRAGFIAPPPTVTQAVRPGFPAEIQQALREHPQARSFNEKYAREQLALGTDPEAIAQAIRTGAEG